MFSFSGPAGNSLNANKFWNYRNYNTGLGEEKRVTFFFLRH